MLSPLINPGRLDISLEFVVQEPPVQRQLVDKEFI